MSEKMTDDEVKALLDGSAHGDDTLQASMLTARGINAIEAAAPVLARAYLARGEELARLRADAQAAAALVVEKAAEMAREGFMIVAPEGIGQRQALDSYRAQISGNILTLSPVDGLAMVEALRKELDDARRLYLHACEPIPVSPDIADVVAAVEEWMNKRGGEDTADQIAAMAIQSYQRATQPERDRLTADLAAAQAQIEALKAILHDAGALRDAADRVSEWFCTEARHLEGPRIQALRMAMVAYDRHMQPTALSVPNFSAGWPLEEGDGSIIVGATKPAKDGE